MGPKHRWALEAIFEAPVRSTIAWREIEAVLAAASAEFTECSGTRVQIGAVKAATAKMLLAKASMATIIE